MRNEKRQSYFFFMYVLFTFRTTILYMYKLRGKVIPAVSKSLSADSNIIRAAKEQMNCTVFVSEQ